MLDSESSEDEETEELRHFWSQLRELGAGSAGSVCPMTSVGTQAAASRSAPLVLRAATAAAAAAAAAAVGAAMELPATPSAPSKDKAAASKRPSPPDSAAWASHAPRLQGSGGGGQAPRAGGAPGPPTTNARRGRCGIAAISLGAGGVAIRGGRLWEVLGDLSFQVLCFLSSGAICRLACAAQPLREACSLLSPSGWRLLTPHLQLCSRTCEARLRKAWLPNVLWLEARDIGPRACQALIPTLELKGPRAARALVALDLRNTHLKGAAPALAAMIAACTGLRSLDLSRTRLRDEGGEYLVGGLVAEDADTGQLRPHRSLRHLALDENGLTSLSGPLLAAAALALPSLEALHLARNSLGDRTARAIAAALAGGSSTGGAGAGLVGGGTSLTRLDLSENRLTAEGLATLAGALGASCSLRSLDAGGNERIGDGLASSPEHAREVAKSLRSAASLRDLHLWRCGLSDEACDLVVDAKPPRLQLLNLAANPFSQELRNRLLRHDGSALSIRV